MVSYASHGNMQHPASINVPFKIITEPPESVCLLAFAKDCRQRYKR